MTITIVLVVLLACSLLTLGWLVWRKWPQLRIIDPSSSKSSRSRQLKYDLMRQRVERVSGKQVKVIQNRLFQPVGKGLQRFVRVVAGKLTAVERSYKARSRVERQAPVDSTVTKQLLEEGKKLMEEALWDRAEKKFIEVISHDAKHVDAYERLGRLYLLKKDYDLAAETFQFLTKLSPNNPSVIAYLGEVEERRGNNKKAYTLFKRAHKLSPNNPKYLDFLLESAIVMNEKLVAMDALEHLKTVNPENKKIESFGERIAQLTIIEVGETEKKKRPRTK